MAARQCRRRARRSARVKRAARWTPARARGLQAADEARRHRLRHRRDERGLAPRGGARRAGLRARGRPAGTRGPWTSPTRARSSPSTSGSSSIDDVHNPNVRALLADLGAEGAPIAFSLSVVSGDDAWTNNGQRTRFGDGMVPEIARLLRDLLWIAGWARARACASSSPGPVLHGLPRTSASARRRASGGSRARASSRCRPPPWSRACSRGRSRSSPRRPSTRSEGRADLRRPSGRAPRRPRPARGPRRARRARP